MNRYIPLYEKNELLLSQLRNKVDSFLDSINHEKGYWKGGEILVVEGSHIGKIGWDGNTPFMKFFSISHLSNQWSKYIGKEVVRTDKPKNSITPKPKSSLRSLSSPITYRYSGDFDHVPPNKLRKVATEFYNIISADLYKNFGIPKIPLKFENLSSKGAGYVAWSNKVPMYMSLNTQGWAYPHEYTIVHEFSHIVEQHFSGTTTNKHGGKFKKYLKALTNRYGLDGMA